MEVAESGGVADVRSCPGRYGEWQRGFAPRGGALSAWPLGRASRAGCGSRLSREVLMALWMGACCFCWWDVFRSREI